MHFDPKRSVWKFDLSPVKCHDLINDPGRSCSISGDASWQNTMTSRPWLWLYSIRSYWRKRFRDLRWRHIPIITSYDLCGFAGQQLPLIHCQIAFESSQTARFIMDIEKQVERSTTGNVCIIWVVTWHWVQGYSSTTKGQQLKTKGHMNFPLADLVHKGKKVRCAKNQISRKNVACRQEKLPRVASPRCGQGLMLADRACRWLCACTREGPRNSCWFGWIWQ